MLELWLSRCTVITARVSFMSWSTIMTLNMGARTVSCVTATVGLYTEHTTTLCSQRRLVVAD